MIKKTLVVYVFHEITPLVENFFNNCIFEDENIDFIIIAKGYDKPLNLPSYVKIIITENQGYCFGGWSHAILTDNIYKNYDYFIFANSSIMGPCIPSYFKGKWTDIYINGLNDDIKLFGSTINTEFNPVKYAHVQSYIFSMTRETLEFLIEKEIFSLTNMPNDFQRIIQEKEIRMSRLIIENGGNIDALNNYYKGIDFRFKDKNPEDYNIKYHDDFMYPKYKNIFWNEYEVVFYKGNRFNLHKY